MAVRDETEASDGLMSNLVRKAILLSWFTIGYNFLEGFVSIGFGVSDESVALAGFGVDSLIEVISALFILWRFRGEVGAGSEISIARERKATFGIGVLFLLLALTTVGASIFQIKSGSHPKTTIPGLLISIFSISFMFWLWLAKRRIAVLLDSASMKMDAQCSWACIKLSIVLFVGSIVFITSPALWWTDSLAAIIIALLIGREGWETVKSVRHPGFSGGCGCKQ